MFSKNNTFRVVDQGLNTQYGRHYNFGKSVVEVTTTKTTHIGTSSNDVWSLVENNEIKLGL